MNILVVNAGSSSLKYQLINIDTEKVIAKGLCERVGSPDSVHKHGVDDNEVVIDRYLPDHDAAVACVMEVLVEGPDAPLSSMSQIDAIGHRIVQGGTYFDKSVLIDDEVIDKIR